jgi:uncharacterized protein YndB with AHSA1/START domain
MTALHFHAERRIAAPPDRVWALLVDLRSWRAWDPTTTSVEGEIVIGGSVRLVTTANAKRTFVLRVTEVVPPRRMVWTSGMPMSLFQGTRTYALAPVADGGTDFEMTEAYSGPLAGIIGRSIPDLGPSFESFSNALKDAAERA